MDKLNSYMLSYLDSNKWYNFKMTNVIREPISYTDSLILKEVFNVDKLPTIIKTKEDEDFENHFNYIKRSLVENEDKYNFVRSFSLDWSYDIKKALELIDSNIGTIRYTDAFIADGLNAPSTESTINLNVDEYPTFKKAVESLNLKNYKVRFMVQRPGCVVPTHIDNFNHNENAKRFGIALNDWQYGQFWHFGKTVWSNWKSGDCIEWNKLTPHGTANVGHSDRYTLQVTGELQ